MVHKKAIQNPIKHCVLKSRQCQLLPLHLNPLNAPGGVLRRHEDVVLITQDFGGVDGVGGNVGDVAGGDRPGLAAYDHAASPGQDDGELLVGV